MCEPYLPKYTWTRTQIDKADPPTDYDWMGYDGGKPIGRVRKEFHGPIKGKWQWVGWTPKPFHHSPPMPNLGYADTARLAVQMSERYWDKCNQISAENS